MPVGFDSGSSVGRCFDSEAKYFPNAVIRVGNGTIKVSSHALHFFKDTPVNIRDASRMSEEVRSNLDVCRSTAGDGTIKQRMEMANRVASQ